MLHLWLYGSTVVGYLVLILKSNILIYLYLLLLLLLLLHSVHLLVQLRRSAAACGDSSVTWVRFHSTIKSDVIYFITVMHERLINDGASDDARRRLQVFTTCVGWAAARSVNYTLYCIARSTKRFWQKRKLHAIRIHIPQCCRIHLGYTSCSYCFSPSV